MKEKTKSLSRKVINQRLILLLNKIQNLSYHIIINKFLNQQQ